MGYFSWKTADSNESIPNRDSIKFRRNRPVYLLQPAGNPPIEEACYEGYGVFGGVDVFEWLARANLSEDVLARLEKSGPEALRDAGIMLDGGNYYQDRDTGKIYSIFHEVAFVPPGQATVPEYIPQRFDEKLKEFGGLSANQLIENRRFVRMVIHAPFPLKFSFKASAKYEELPASRTCGAQGYFYNDGDDEGDD